MPNPLRSLLDRFVQRCVALSARLFATTLDTLRLECEVEQERRLEELARRYESDGMPELAARLRDRAKSLAMDEVAGAGESLLQQFSESPAALEDAANSTPPRRLGTSKPAAARKPRKKKPAPAETPQPSQPAADTPSDTASAFFPLNCNSSSQEGDQP